MVNHPRFHYDEVYFAWQSQNMEIQAKANAFKFEPWIKPSLTVLDFGCGTGMLLKELGGGLGVEINPAAWEQARKNGIEIRTDLAEVADNSVDLVISNHALEHVEHPLDVMRGMYRVLRPGGRMVVVVPVDASSVPYRKDDQDFHLYSWSAGNLGNLASAAGFKIEQADQILHTWPPKWAAIQKSLGWGGFHLACRLWAMLDRRRRQVRVVGVKPTN